MYQHHHHAVGGLHRACLACRRGQTRRRVGICREHTLIAHHVVKACHGGEARHRATPTYPATFGSGIYSNSLCASGLLRVAREVGDTMVEVGGAERADHVRLEAGGDFEQHNGPGIRPVRFGADKAVEMPKNLRPPPAGPT